VLQKLAVIGEAAARPSEEAKSRHPGTHWKAFVSFRNIAIHAYFSVKWPTVWLTATQQVPPLRTQVVSMLREVHVTNEAASDDTAQP